MTLLGYIHGRAGVVVIIVGVALRGGLFLYGRRRASRAQRRDQHDGHSRKRETR